MKLSILVPSNRPEGLTALTDSLKKNSVTDDVELVVLVDDENEYIEFHHNMIVIHYPPKQPLSIAHLLHECYKRATGDWIMFANDDIICNTPAWDEMVFKAIEQYGKDGIALFWPDDCMFGVRLSCFPIVSRKFLELVDFFPQPYQRYKVDDTIHYLIPNTRRYFMSNIQFKHDNDKGEIGFKLDDGRVYPVFKEAAEFDNNAWRSESGRRSRMKTIVNKELGIDTPKVMISVLTQEMARRADFYDMFDSIEAPPNVEVMKIKIHSQSPARARNMVIDQAIENGCTHILFLDDDVYPPLNIVSKLLSHDKDVVTGLYLSRSYPHRPYLFHIANPDGSCVWKHLSSSERGLIEIVNAGLGAVLINTKVFEKMEKPYVRLGELESDQWCDDIGFFNRVRKAGFKIYCDLDVWCGHAFSGIIFPEYKDGKWYTNYWTASGEGRPLIEQIEAPIEEEKHEEVAV